MVALVPILAGAAVSKAIDIGLERLFGSGEAGEAAAEIAGAVRDPLVSALTSDLSANARRTQGVVTDAGTDPGALRTRGLS